MRDCDIFTSFSLYYFHFTFSEEKVFLHREKQVLMNSIAYISNLLPEVDFNVQFEKMWSAWKYFFKVVCAVIHHLCDLPNDNAK